MRKVTNIVRIGRELVSSLLFPKRCPICDELLSPEEADKGIHPACENKLFPVKGAVCMHCGRPLGQLYSPIRQNYNVIQNYNAIQSDNAIQNHNVGNRMKKEEDGFDFYQNIPSHVTIESTYEYCRECVRKGYVSELPYINGQRGRVYQNSCAQLPYTRPSSNITQAKSLYLYRGDIKTAMYRFKYANKREYAAFFAQRAVQEYGAWFGITQDTDALSRFDVIIPVPMYRPKQRQRGYNQAETFANELSYLTGIPVDTSCIRRIKDTTPQKNLDDIQRKNNLENAFQIIKSIVQYKHILLVDDIYTTGYTAQTVAMELKKEGKCQIYLLSICIGGVS